MLEANNSVKSDWAAVNAVCKAATSAAVAALAKLACKASTVVAKVASDASRPESGQTYF